MSAGSLQAPVNPPPHVYTSVGFDRMADRRNDVAWMAQQRQRNDAIVVAIRGIEIAIAESADGPQIFPLEAADVGVDRLRSGIFLGQRDDRPVFAVDLSTGRVPAQVRFVDLRALGPVLPLADASLLAYARALAHWHITHRHCGRCGLRLRTTQAGHARWCAACRVEVFPRTDPAVIVLVTQGERCVLARSRRFPSGMYSTLAGFVEPGESLESTLYREVLEEVGLRITKTSYRSSQPWPFPQSLMLGFRAETEDGRITIEPEEIEDARWCSRDELRDPQRRPVDLPRPDSIARFLIEEWLREGGS